MAAEVSGYTRDMGIAIMMEHLVPGAGGRHRHTRSYGQTPDLSLLPRQVFAREIQDLRSLYQREDVYTEIIKQGLRAIIQLNQSTWTGVFESLHLILHDDCI